MVEIELLTLSNQPEPEPEPEQPDSLYVKCQDMLDMQALQSTEVQVIGLGATGSVIVELLSRYGIPVVGYDYDTVGIHNVHNQMYWIEHVDMCKGDALAHLLKQTRGYNLRYENIAIRLGNVKENIDLDRPIVLAIDSVDSVREILMYLKDKPFKYILYPGLPNNITELALADGVVRVITPGNIQNIIDSLGNTTDEEEEEALLKEIKGCAAQQYALLVFDVAVQTAKLVIAFWYCQEKNLRVRFKPAYYISALRPYIYE